MFPHHSHQPATPVTPPPPPIGFTTGDTILFLGDSITAEEEGYVAVIAQALARTRSDLLLSLLNAGREGDTTRTALQRLQYDVLDHNPQWVILSLGINDLNNLLAGSRDGVPPDEFSAHYRQILSILAAAGIGVVPLTTTMIGEDVTSKRNKLLKDYNGPIRTLAAEGGLRLVDVNRAFHNAYDRAATYKQAIQLTRDGIHPNRQGHALIARTFLSELGLLR